MAKNSNDSKTDSSKDTQSNTAKVETTNGNIKKDTTEKTEMRYTKRQFVYMSSFPGYKRDLFKIALKENQTYTLEEANAKVQALVERMF